MHEIIVHKDYADCSCGWNIHTRIGSTQYLAEIHARGHTPAVIIDKRFEKGTIR